MNSHTMIKMVLVFPNKSFFKMAYSTFEEHTQYQENFLDGVDTNEYTLEEIVFTEKTIDRSLFKNADVLISRGFMAEILKKEIKDIPIVEISIVGIDLVKNLVRMKKKFGNKKVGVIGTKNMIYGVGNLAEIVDLEIEVIYQNSISDVKEVIDRAVSQNCKMILGGVETCAYGNKLGLDTMIIQTGKEALWQAIAEAKKVAQIHRIEQEKTQRFKIILDYTHEGILSLDKENRITICNEMAQQTLSLKSDVVGKYVDEVFRQGDFKKLICENKNYKNEIIEFAELKLVVSKVFVEVKGMISGSVITFQDITKLQRMEQSVRRKVYERGHIAKHQFSDIIGKSKVLTEAIRQAKEFSSVDADILITGDSGTGKELFAQSIHNHSKRAEGPFVAVNCAAIQANLLESELFGYVSGAFTGANKNGKEGLFEQAHGGTIFLDEIAEISMEVQSKLLRVLQEREVMRIGDNKVIPLNIRVVAATNKNLLKKVKKGEFREDLYYRLNVLNLMLPSLNERTGDIPLIAEHFIKRYGEYYGKQNVVLTEEAKIALNYNVWSGNVRELNNMCMRLVVLNQTGVIGKEEVQHIRKDISIRAGNNSDEEEGVEPGFEEMEKRFEREKIKEALEKTNYNRSKAAELLGMSRSTLWKKINKYS